MEQLGRYVLDRKLAQGGMAEVFLARELSPSGPERVCVVKRLLPHLSIDVTFVEMFLDEAKLAARLAHPGIAQIYDFGHEHETFYLAMEYVPGANLKTILEQRLQPRRPVPLPVAARLTAQVALALDHAHRATDEKGRPLDIIHRDISPQNIMVSTSGDVKLIDFGIAKAASDSHRTVAGTLKGKYAYMSPEQLRQQKVDQRTDIYALGLVLYELITGKPAVPASDNMNALMMSAALRRYEPIDATRPETPKRLRHVLDRAIALSPDDRYQAASDFAAELEAWLSDSRLEVKPMHVAALVTDPAALPTDPIHASVSRRPTHAEAGAPAFEAPTLRDVPPPPGVKEMALAKLRGGAADASLLPTQPEKAAPDIAAAMARPRPARVTGSPASSLGAAELPPTAMSPSRAPSQTEVEMDLGASRPLEKDTHVSGAANVLRPSAARETKVSNSPGSRPPSQIETLVSKGPEVPRTVLVPGPTAVVGKGPRPRRRVWPWLLVLLLAAPPVAGWVMLKFLPHSHPARAWLTNRLGPLLEKLPR